MTTSCSLTPIYGFPSAASFAKFDTALLARLAAKQLVAVVPLALPNVSAAFVCADCQQVWVLADPDNAWRGFFLPQEEAVRHLQQMQKAPTTAG